MTDTELKPCPFCGSEIHNEVSGGRDEDVLVLKGSYWMNCVTCDCDGPIRHTEAEAIAAWNQRAPIAVTDEMVERAFEVFNKIASEPNDPLQRVAFRGGTLVGNKETDLGGLALEPFKVALCHALQAALKQLAEVQAKATDEAEQKQAMINGYNEIRNKLSEAVIGEDWYINFQAAEAQASRNQITDEMVRRGCNAFDNSPLLSPAQKVRAIIQAALDAQLEASSDE